MTVVLVLLLLRLAAADYWTADLAGCPGCRKYHKPGANFSSVLTYQHSVLVGGRNALYDLNFKGLNDQYYPDKLVETDEYEYCITQQGQQPKDCHNYYTLLIKLSDTNVFVCSTSSFSPSCETRLRNELQYGQRSNAAKVNYISSNPHSTLSYLRLRDANYTAYVGTEEGSNTGIFRIARVNLLPGSYAIKAFTPTDHDSFLKSPTFVYSFETDEHIYFVFQEIAVEEITEQVYSRISRVCKDDTGATSPFHNKKFLTFAKVRIQCSYSQAGQSPYQFDRITGAYHRDGILYTLFSGSNTIIETGSVFCLFKMADIEESFNGRYMDAQRYWQEVMPAEAPFHCGEDPNWTVRQAMRYHILAETLNSQQVVYYTRQQLGSLDVSSVTIGSEEFQIMHAGSNNGNLVRVGFFINRFSELERIRHREFNVGKGQIKKIVRDQSRSGDVYVLSNDWISYVPLSTDCSIYTTCQSCSAAFPSCGWCVSATLRNTCTSADRCNSKGWQSAFEKCPALPGFRVRPTNVTVSHKSQVVFNCASTTSDVSHWLNETGTMSKDVLMPLNGSLIIPSATVNDNGCYTCELRAVSGTVSSRACLTVLIPPYFQRVEERMIEVEVGRDVALPCPAAGSPPPTVIWRKMGDGQALPDGAYLSTNNQLKIIRAILGDSGQYQCSAKNTVGQSWSEPINLSVINQIPNQNTIEQPEGTGSGSMVALATTVCAVLVVVVIVVAIAHCYRKRRSANQKQQQFAPIDNDDMLPGYSTYLDPRLTPIGSLRGDASLASVDALRHCYSETSTPRWLPPHTIMSAPLGGSGDQIPPPPYHQYFLDRAALMGARGLYENVTPTSPGTGGLPPSPTEQVPIAFSDHFTPGRAHTGPCFYVPYSPTSAATLKDNPSVGYARPMTMLDNSRQQQQQQQPSGGGSWAGTMPRTHVYDEIIVPAGMAEERTVRPPVPPRPSRTPSRSPPAIPTSISEEVG